MPPAGNRPPGAPGRRRFRPGIILGVLALLLALIVGYYIYAPLHAWNTVTKIQNVPTAERPADQPGTAFLLVGTDARDGLSPEESKKIGVNARDDKGRTDSMMLLYTPPSGKSVLISLPRDTYVKIKGFGASKLNGAYSIGGPKLLTQTVEQLTGLRIKGYAEVGFGGFSRLVDATKGLDICVEKPIPAEMGYAPIAAGCQHLDTKQAMWYVRNRHSEVNQDLGRITRQRKFISAMMKDAASPATFLDPVRYWEVTHSVAGAVGVGEETGIGEAWAAFNGMKGLSSGGISMTVPISNGNAYTEVGSSVVWDAKRCKEMFGQLRTGSTENIERFKDE